MGKKINKLREIVRAKLDSTGESLRETVGVDSYNSGRYDAYKAVLDLIREIDPDLGDAYESSMSSESFGHNDGA